MSDNALLHQVLAELGALRSEVADLKADLNGRGKSVGLWESARELHREVDDLRVEVGALQTTIAAQSTTIAALQCRPGQTAVRWVDAVGLAVVIALATSVVIGCVGVTWTNYASHTTVIAPRHP